MSKTDRHLLCQKVHQRISVMKTNILYVSRELAPYKIYISRFKYLYAEGRGEIYQFSIHLIDRLCSSLLRLCHDTVERGTNAIGQLGRL